MADAEQEAYHMTCRHCGGHEDVRHGVCVDCRGHAAEAKEPAPEDPSLEPAHDRPWVARSAFTGRKRRSPRM